MLGGPVLRGGQMAEAKLLRAMSASLGCPCPRCYLRELPSFRAQGDRPCGAPRARELTPGLAVLSMADENQLSEAVRQGVAKTGNPYLMKSFDRKYLLLKVRAALKG